MIINKNPVQHLTYCLNVHPGEGWDANFTAIKKYALEIRQLVAPGKPFGLGLRLSWIAANQLSKPERMAEFKAFLEKHDLYVFTINGFPYGQFHGMAVKQSVYDPDWQTDDRVIYTNLLADILAELLPENVMGSISTVPGGYGEKLKTETLKAEIVQDKASCLGDIADNIARCATHFAEIEKGAGKYIMLAMEPEPDCLFDSADSTIDFFNDVLAESDAMRQLNFDWNRYIGVCLDTCHMSVVFDDPAESLQKLLDNNITIAKVQISAALKAETGAETAEHLTAFAENVYLHQLRLRSVDGNVISYPDLTDEALEAVAEAPGGEVRVHMHVPLYFEQTGTLRSTSGDLTQQFFEKVAAANISHLEIETYTFNVLPSELSNIPIEDSIKHEFQVVIDILSSLAKHR